MVPGLIDRRLELLAQLGQAFEPLLVSEILVERVFHPHRRVIGQPFVTAPINIGEMEQTPYRKIAREALAASPAAGIAVTLQVAPSIRDT